MNQRTVKKLRQQARREVNRRVRPEPRWWARPRVFRAWAVLGTRLLSIPLRRGWRIGHWWLALIRSVPQRGVRYVLR